MQWGFFFPLFNEGEDSYQEELAYQITVIACVDQAWGGRGLPEQGCGSPRSMGTFRRCPTRWDRAMGPGRCCDVTPAQQWLGQRGAGLFSFGLPISEQNDNYPFFPPIPRTPVLVSGSINSAKLNWICTRAPASFTWLSSWVISTEKHPRM